MAGPGADARQVHAERGLAVGMRVAGKAHAESLARELHGIGEQSLLETDSKKHNPAWEPSSQASASLAWSAASRNRAVKQVLLSGSMTHGSASILTNYCSGSVHRRRNS